MRRPTLQVSSHSSPTTRILAHFALPNDILEPLANKFRAGADLRVDGGYTVT